MKKSRIKQHNPFGIYVTEYAQKWNLFLIKKKET